MLKELLEMALNLNDTKLRKLNNSLVVDMNKAIEVVECVDENKIDIEKKEISYIS